MDKEIKEFQNEIFRLKKNHLNETTDLLNQHAREKADQDRKLKLKHRQELEQKRSKHNEEINELTDRMLRERNYDMHLLNKKMEKMLEDTTYERSSTQANFQMVIFHMLYSSIFSFCLKLKSSLI